MSDDWIVPKTDADWAHWKPMSEDDWLSERYPFRPSLRHDIWGRGTETTPGPRERNLGFHLSRSNSQNESREDDLCLHCQHFKYGPLFSPFRYDDVRYEPKRISLGDLLDLETRPECPFCHIVMCTIRAHVAVYRTREKHISVNFPITYTIMEHAGGLSILLYFDNGPSCNIAVKQVLPTYLESIPEVNPIVGTSISWTQVRRWIDLCSISHKECRPTVTAPSGMRLIDVKDRKITPELSPCDRHAFVALSYVWGEFIDPRKCILLKDNTAHLEQTNGLELLPKTIEDAMTICENLGERFLWVDRLCIVQDDEAKKGHQIHAMADIFQSALFTIVSASGNGMESPIPGISTKRQTFQSQTVIAGLQVTSALPRLSRSLSGATWSQRGWTYQESILSSRKLYFTDVEVWFTCSKGFQREDVSLKDSLSGEIEQEDILMTRLHGGVYRSDILSGVMGDYWRHLNEYTKKSLTYESDIYNAFTGILTALFGEDSTVYGLPKLCLDEALLWRLAEDTSSWDIRDCTVVKERLLCPSWAWSSINGAIQNGSGCIFGEHSASLVIWSFVDEDGNAKTIYTEFGEGFYLRLSLAFAWRGGCFEAPFPSDLREKLELDLKPLEEWARYYLSSRWPTRKAFWNEVCSQGGPDSQPPLTSFNHLRPGMLLTRTQTAVLRLGTYREYFPKLGYFEILNNHGDMVGAVDADELSLKSEIKKDPRLETVICELMALSLSQAPIPFLYRGEYQFRNWTNEVVRVFLISWDKIVPVARRVSIGWVYLKAWVEIERTWKTVVLE